MKNLRRDPRTVRDAAQRIPDFFVFIRSFICRDLSRRSAQTLSAWYEEAQAAVWDHPNELKLQYRNASVLSDKRVVFNIHGNSFRLIVDIEHRLKIVLVVWFGTHEQYDKIDAKK